MLAILLQISSEGAITKLNPHCKFILVIDLMIGSMTALLLFITVLMTIPSKKSTYANIKKRKLKSISSILRRPALITKPKEM